MAQTKATKKFEKKHLKDTLKRRKELAKVKQRHQRNDKRKARRAQEHESDDDQPKNDAAPKTSSKRANGGDNKAFANMSVDEFFQGGFNIPEPVKQPAKKTGKRKRAEKPQLEPEVDGSDTSGSSSGHELAEDSHIQDNTGSEEESEDETAHKEQLEKLAEKDPEFFKYLQENDDELLNFDDDADLDGLQLSESEDEETPTKKRKKGNVDAGEDERAPDNEITKAFVHKWRDAIHNKQSLRATKEVMLAFRAAVHVNDEGKQFKYTISNPDVYHELLVTAMECIPKVVRHHMPLKETAGGKVRVSTDSKKYKNLAPLLKSHTHSVTVLLETLSDGATQRRTLSSVELLLPYLLSFKKAIRELSRVVVEIWSDSGNTEASRLAAFLVLRKLVVIGDPGIKESVLKASYQGLVKGSRVTTIHTINGINLMKNSAAELWGIDANIGYTSGFTYIRQLAIHLRTSITNRSKDSHKTVYNWQYVHSLDFWSRVLALHCDSLREAKAGKQSPLRPLIYPVVQVTLGALRLIPTATYFPLRFQLTRSLLRLSLATGTYIPLAPALHEVLASAEMRKPPKPSTLKPVDFETAIRVPKSYLRTRTYQTGVGEQVAELLSEFFVLWAKNIAFPELALPVVVMLKRWLKEVSGGRRGGGSRSGGAGAGNKNGKVNGAIVLVVQKLEAQSKWIEARRAKVEFAPNDRAGVEGFLKDVEWEKSPLGAFVVGQRKAREERKKLVEEGRRREERRRKNNEKDSDAEEIENRFEDSEEDMDVDGDVDIEDIDGDEDEDED
ncbi:Noc2p family-domain-containing protein [Lineolata rhizophorae]|uniref:Noc2p family-domain-containing protein n=1 Tax=Lineolata rhizophorae TaxID=578093 RepID=A0A6A6NSJ3_9PEZI|nr:Noc2p family-domain-containing protein [Lineolata rhizophorae]